MLEWLVTAFLLFGWLLRASVEGSEPVFQPSLTVVPVPTAETGCSTDLAITGPGYFLVREPEENLVYVTRHGTFRLDATGFVVNSDGLRMQGFVDSALTEISDLHIDPWERPDDADPYAQVLRFSFQSDGRLLVGLSDGTEYVQGQVVLQRFGRPSKLRKMGFGLYAVEPAALPLSQPVAPAEDGPGLLAVGQLELLVSRVEITQLKTPGSPAVQGVLYDSGSPTDLAIEGKGFFVVRDPTQNVYYATRAGAFLTGTYGYLVNHAGLRVQGYTNATSAGIGDVQIGPTGGPFVATDTGVATFWINHFGKIAVQYPDGTLVRGGQILLRDCVAPTSLVRTNFGLYPLVDAPGLWTAMTAPGHAGLGWIFSCMGEVSQFDESILSARQNLNFFAQGMIRCTDSPTDVAIIGAGLFSVRNPASNVQYATRCGAFHLDAGGFLVTSDGFRVQGFTNAGYTASGDVVLTPEGATSSNVTVTAICIDSVGKVQALLSDGTHLVRGPILLQWFRNPRALKLGASQLYSQVEEALPMFTSGIPCTLGLGRLCPGALEDLTPPPALQLPPATGVRLLVSDLLYGVSILETSRDCVQWNPVGQIHAGDMGEAEWFDPDGTQAPCRFYRVSTTFSSSSVGTLQPEKLPSQ